MAIWPIALLRDDFENNQVNACWAANAAGSATVAETGGQAVFTLPSSTAGSHLAYYVSTAAYDLTGDSCHISIGTMVATGVAATAFFALLLDNSNYYQWTQTSGTLKAQKIVAGVTTDLYSVAWSSTTYKYLRIRESSGTVYFDSSTSASGGGTWTNRGSTTIASAFAVTSLQVQFGASCGNIASPGSFRLDMFNVIIPALSTAWHWTDADWQITNRHKPYTLASTGNIQAVIVTAGGKDASGNLTGTIRYFAGPVGSASGGYAQLTEYSTLVAAQAAAFDIPVDGRVDLPALVDCRIHRIYHRSTDGLSYTLREYVPRRIVQADDIEAETIKAINIAANVITADKIYAAFTITGKNIQTATSGARVVLSGDAFGGFIGYNATDTYSTAAGTGTYQVFWSKADGKLYAGTGKVVLNSVGMQIIVVPPTTSLSAIYWTNTATNSDIASIEISSADQGGGTYNSAQVIRSGRTDTAYIHGSITLQAYSHTKSPAIVITASDATGASIELQAPTYIINNGLNLGTATGAGAGQLAASGNVGLGVAVQSNGRLYVKGTDTSSSNWCIVGQDSAGTNLFYARNDGAVLISKSGGLIGFYGTAPVAKPTVSGSRGGNAALGALLVALNGLGLLTDSSSA